MPSYRTPGVYFEWLDPGRSGVRQVRTDIAGFVGIAARGPLHEPRRLTSWTQFVSIFGGHIRQGFLAYAVAGFFANGGEICWVVRVADPVQARAAALYLVDPTGWPLFRLEATSCGTWAHRLEVTAIPSGPRRFSLLLRTPEGLQEFWSNLSTAEDEDRYACKILNREANSGERLVQNDQAGSSLVTASEPDSPLGIGQDRLVLGRGTARMKGGRDGLATLNMQHVVGFGGPTESPWGLAALENVDEIAIVAIPDIVHPTSAPAPKYVTPPLRCDLLEQPVLPPLAPRSAMLAIGDEPPEYAPPFPDDQIDKMQREMVAHCEQLKDRVAILDALPTEVTADQLITRRRRFSTSYAALYAPWLRVPDPLQLDGLLRDVPPCGHVAGIYARGDRRVGVHKAPANEPLEEVPDVTVVFDDLVHAELNDSQVNAIRAYPGRGVRVAGARTLSVEPEWLYINVRRLMSFIEESIDEQTQWVVFEPNNPVLWRDLSRVITAFLDDLWHRGMLDGAKAEDAYSVVCDETTNTDQALALGQLIAMIGVQPPWPAEFVIVRIGKTEQGTAILEGSAATNG